MINARGETLLEKPSFKNLVSSKRCIVITDGYFEWQNIGTIKTPHYFHDPEKKILPMAGLWDEWRSANGELMKTYTVITTTPKPEFAHIHTRMPVILTHPAIDIWVNTRDHTPAVAMDHILPYQDELAVYPVSTLVNSPKNNSARCITPI
jgi:putative SOS response-associated peptidase YedK